MMPSRKPRRSFAAPLILTVAALPACIVGSNKPAAGTTTTTAPEERDHRGSGDTTTMTNPPPVDTSQDRSWTISLQDDGSCVATSDAGATSPVDCPDGIAKGESMSMWANAGETDCYVSYNSSSCPEGASCNPPPPRVSSCPQ